MISLDDDFVTSAIAMTFGNSDPGDELHHLLLIREGVTTLGLPKPDRTLYAIAPAADDGHEASRMTATAILAATCEPGTTRPVLAIFAYEVITLDDLPDDEVAENRARVLGSTGHLEKHPQAAEATMLYAAARDGRRWTGQHWLTGARTGEIEGPTCWPAAKRSERDRWQHGRLIRTAVGLRW